MTKSVQHTSLLLWILILTKAQTTLQSSDEQQEFFSLQKAWEILCHPNSKAEYDKQLQSSRQNIEVIASEIEVGDMIVASTADTMELLYPCRCGDYFCITSCELGEMGILVTEDWRRASDIWFCISFCCSGCGSCSHKIRLIINKNVLKWFTTFSSGLF
jgi:diphthamide biosynthesis protein 4